MNPKVVSSVMAALLVLLGASASNVQAQAPSHAAVVIENPTQQPLNYKIRWGAGGFWQHIRVEPGQEIRHSYPLDVAGLAPAPEIEFDGVGFGRLSRKLNFNAVNDPADGLRYKFLYSANGLCLNLYRR